jgi:hypothetical protein
MRTACSRVEGEFRGPGTELEIGVWLDIPYKSASILGGPETVFNITPSEETGPYPDVPDYPAGPGYYPPTDGDTPPIAPPAGPGDAAYTASVHTASTGPITAPPGVPSTHIIGQGSSPIFFPGGNRIRNTVDTGDLVPDGPKAATKFSVRQYQAPYTYHTHASVINRDEGRYAAPSTVWGGADESHLRPKTQVLQLYAPNSTRRIDWSAERQLVPPEPPDPVSLDGNNVLIHSSIQPQNTVMMTDGEKAVFKLSGSYTYVNQYPTGAGDPLDFGIPPYVDGDEVGRENTLLPPQYYRADLVDQPDFGLVQMFRIDTPLSTQDMPVAPEDYGGFDQGTADEGGGSDGGGGGGEGPYVPDQHPGDLEPIVPPPGPYDP